MGASLVKDPTAKAKMHELSARTPLWTTNQTGISTFLDEQLPVKGGLFKSSNTLLNKI